MRIQQIARSRLTLLASQVSLGILLVCGFPQSLLAQGVSLILCAIAHDGAPGTSNIVWGNYVVVDAASCNEWSLVEAAAGGDVEDVWPDRMWIDCAWLELEAADPDEPDLSCCSCVVRSAPADMATNNWLATRLEPHDGYCR